METNLDSARAACNILAALESGSAALLRFEIDRAQNMPPSTCAVPGYTEERLELLDAVAASICSRDLSAPTEVELDLLWHLAAPAQRTALLQ
ncbi:MAG: hypothetical protein HUU41_14245 [Bryobacteraceae bacterium]|nr:hypothetical protein [Bryobacterales bacterium]MEB2362584.1 hypothetical protein [Bryobacterales bacterium]NUN02271.1 hypothetical protein [Bryobacteraceae bacterium]